MADRVLDALNTLKDNIKKRCDINPGVDVGVAAIFEINAMIDERKNAPKPNYDLLEGE